MKCLLFALPLLLSICRAQEMRIDLSPKMIVNESKIGDPSGLVDEQREIIGAPVGNPSKSWKINSRHRKGYPFSVHLDLGSERNLSKLWIFDTNGKGDVSISVGEPGAWKEIATYDCAKYMQWASIDLDANTRYLRLTKKSPSANFTEIAVYEYTPEAYNALMAKKAAEAKKKAARTTALKIAMEEMKKRPKVNLGEPFRDLYLVDEVDCSKLRPGHDFHESPEGASKVQTILGRPCRVLTKTKDEAAYFTYRIGKMKMLQPGAAYVLAIDYPEDAPRTVIVSNTANETIRGFHTGRTVGDSFHPKYVNNLNESIDVPLSGKWETWTHMFRLHDRFTEYNKLPRGAKPRPHGPEDGFYVNIIQYSAKNIPMSKGAAVGRIRLFAVPEPEKLTQKINYPHKDLPHRRLFWREEMADGVLSGKTPDLRGLTNFLDWYKFKVHRMKFLGMNTFSKDLLEFGANQGWDSGPHGGNMWVYMNAAKKGWWAQIVELMGKNGMEVFPYYEYSGSKGQKGLGFQRRCKPLTRKDGYYTHIKWVERATADITDPDTYADFKKMLDLTVLNLKDKAKFAGVWLRPRSQLPISFADETLKRYANDTGKAITRQMLIEDKALYKNYINWWNIKRRDFLAAMRDYIREGGVKDGIVMFTGCPSEPGVSFTGWDPVMVTDKPEAWRPILKLTEHLAKDKPIQPLTVKQVVNEGRYLAGLLAPGKDWGGYEVRHARPADDPQHYRDTDGVMITHAFNRLYTVASPATFDAYRAKSGLAMVRYYALNENMVFGKDGKDKIGYFVNDMERAGPYCMMAEAVAMANGDPSMIGYLSGGNYGRGFPKYVRDFNAAYLSLPALPSKRVDASSDPEIVVREIKTKHGSYYAVVSTSMQSKKDVTVKLPAIGTVTNAATGTKIGSTELSLSFYPYQLQTFLVK